MLPKIHNGVFVFFVALLYSLMEIEMEGKDGWCKNLPTAKNVLVSFTWYHILMMVIIILIFYQTFQHLDIWMTVFYITSFFLIEDFLWFVFNPFYGINNYKQENIPWHKNWSAELPIENFVGLAIFIFTYIKTKFKTEHMNSLIYMGIGVAVAICLAPLYHVFYKKIRMSDKAHQTY